MPEFRYTPDTDLPIHAEGAIKLISTGFQSHEAGLPEWLKNSSDAYAREDAPERKRVIFVVFDSGRGQVSPSISCLDFAGMTSQMIDENFRIWADPQAVDRSGRTAGVQGGHGNGGKCYMTQMFDEYAMLATVKRGRGNRYGVRAGSFVFGYIPDVVQGRNFVVNDLRTELEHALEPRRCPINVFPDEALAALQMADGFTLVTGVGPKDYGGNIPIKHLVDNLQNHTQMVQTLEMCKVYVVVNGRLLNQGQPLGLPRITPMQGAEAPRIIDIPRELPDPHSERIVETTPRESQQGQLVLRTSEVSLRYRKKARHNIAYRARTGFIGYVPVGELDIQSSYRDYIYGECHLETLEPYKQNARARLADSPLTRAVEQFISQEIQNYARHFEARERRQYDQEEKNALSRMNDALDKWKNRFLSELMQGLWGPGTRSAGQETRSLPVGVPAKIELTLSHGKAGLGVALRPRLRFLDLDGQPIRAVPYRWGSEENNVAMVDEDLMIINTFSYGRTEIYAETLDGRIRSNRAPLDVVHILQIRIVPPELEIPAGSRQKLDAICRLENGEETSGAYLVWTEDNPNVARVSSAGFVFGFSQGETRVTAEDDNCSAQEPAVVKVIPGIGRGEGGKRGTGFPKILVSGINPDPDTNEQRNLSREDPPVYQDAQDVERNIWWINSSAPLARLYLDRERNYGHQSQAWRMYHLERVIEIIVQIALTNSPEPEPLSVDDWIGKWGSQAAEIQEAAVKDLAAFIRQGLDAKGDLPTE